VSEMCVLRYSESAAEYMCVYQKGVRAQFGVPGARSLTHTVGPKDAAVSVRYPDHPRLSLILPLRLSL